MFGLVHGCVLVGFALVLSILARFFIINWTTIFLLTNRKGKAFASFKKKES
jgi:hypothetical protein